MLSTHGTVIIGGGLSGLAVARELTAQGEDWVLLEARPRLGGRIFSLEHKGVGYDLGPAWIWPHQQRIQNLAAAMSVPLFAQYAEGRLIFQDEHGAIRRDLTFAPMAGTFRVSGGVSNLISALAETLPSPSLRLEHVVQTVERDDQRFIIRGTQTDGTAFQILAERVVLALPPRLAAERIEFSGLLSHNALKLMSGIPTWMANSGKVMALYEIPFWRHEGFSGDAISHRGPLMEIHDSSPADGDTGALFGFLHPQIVAMNPPIPDLEQAVRAQLAHLFGDQAAQPLTLASKLWLTDPQTAIPGDEQLSGHPSGSLPPGLRAAQQQGLFFAGAEVAPDEPGLLEGALAAAEACIRALGVSESSQARVAEIQ